MRVLFDGFWWVGGPISNRTVLQETVKAWCSTFPGDEVLVAVPGQDLTAVADDIGDRATVLAVHSRPHAVAAAIEIPLLARRHRADVVICQNYGPVPGIFPGVRAVFIHDVLFQSNPEWFTRTELAYFWAMPRLARSASVVFSSSATEGRRIQALNNHITCPVIPVGLGLSEAVVVGPANRPDAVPEGLTFVLSVGRLNVRKNLLTTIKAAVASNSISPKRPLLVVGQAQGKTEKDVDVVNLATADGTVRFLGHVSDEGLKWLYQNADLFVFLSLDEGFGLPPLEARANGCPVLASDIEVFRETMGEDVSYANPLDANDIAAAMDRALPPTRSRAALLVEPKYSWETTVSVMRRAIVGVHSHRAGPVRPSVVMRLLNLRGGPNNRRG